MARCWGGRGPHNHIYPGKAHRDDMSAMQNEAEWEKHQLWRTSFNIFHTHKTYRVSDLLGRWKVHVFHSWNIFILYVKPMGVKCGELVCERLNWLRQGQLYISVIFVMNNKTVNHTLSNLKLNLNTAHVSGTNETGRSMTRVSQHVCIQLLIKHHETLSSDLSKWLHLYFIFGLTVQVRVTHWKWVWVRC